MYKKDKESLKKCVNRLVTNYNFKGLVHFTDFSNLENIFNSGYLKSREQCYKENINFHDGASHEVLGHASSNVKNCVRFYYRGKTPTLYDNEGIKYKEYHNSVHLPIPVYLLFDEELIYLKTTKFSNGNATTSNTGNDAVFFRDIDWDAVYHFGYFDMANRGYIIRMRQAELLSEEPVPLKYLKKVIFRCNADEKRAVNLFGYNKKYKVDMELFSDKNTNSCKIELYNNFVKDYRVSFLRNSRKKTKVEVKLDFQKCWSEYNKEFRVLDSDMNEIDIDDFSVEYENSSGIRLKECKSENESIILIFGNYKLKWNKLEIYINGILSVEEFFENYKIIEDIIEEFEISYNKNSKTDEVDVIINKKFKDGNFKKYKHYYKILNKDNEEVKKNRVTFPDDKEGLEWYTELGKCKKGWFKIQYYIHDVLCAEEKLKW